MMITIILRYFFANGLCFARMHRPARMCSKGSRFTLRVWGFRVCSLEVAQPSATVRRRRVRSLRPDGKWSLFEVSNVAQPSFVWQAWHFVTFQHVSSRQKPFCITGALFLQGFRR